MHVWQAHKQAVLSLAYAPDGGALATIGDADPAARVWDLAAGKERYALSLLQEPALSQAFDPDSRTLAVGRPEAIELWDPATGRQRLRLDAYRHHSTSLAYSLDGLTLLSAGTQTPMPVMVEDELVAVQRVADPVPGVPLAGDVEALAWDLESLRLANNVVERTGHSLGLVSALDAQTLLWSDRHAGADKRYSAALLDVPSRWLRAVLDPPGPFHAAALSPDGRLLATAIRSDVYLWPIAPMPDPVPQRVTRLSSGRPVFHPDAPPLAACCVMPGEAERIDAVAFSPDGRRLLAGSAKGSVRVWNVPDPPLPALNVVADPPEEARAVAAFDWEIGPVTALAVAPDGLTAAAGSRTGRVIVWDLDF